jgi:hypothetical protein
MQAGGRTETRFSLAAILLMFPAMKMFAALAAVLLLLSPAPAAAVPEEDLDVPYVPTPDAAVERMLEMGEVTAEDYLIDLGSGDGRIPIAAARRGARALGVEIDPARRWRRRDSPASRRAPCSGGRTCSRPRSDRRA